VTWSLVHGFVMLLLDDRLKQLIAKLPGLRQRQRRRNLSRADFKGKTVVSSTRWRSFPRF
jgi:hypothetical protein